MFCSKCGNLLEDAARFCDKCGNPTGGGGVINNVATKEKLVDDEVKILVKPKFKTLYHMLGAIIASIITGIFIGFVSLVSGEILISLIVMVIVSLFGIGLAGIGVIFKKMQMKKMEYAFYNTKVCYKDSFLNQVEKEVKYKHIRECLLSRSIMDRIFGFGRIVLYTNAETGFANGIFIPCVENSEEVYKQIKALLDD